MATRSAIWNYFTANESNSDRARCNTCHQEYSCKSGITSSLINHLKSKHKDVFEKYELMLRIPTWTMAKNIYNEGDLVVYEAP